MEIRSFGAFLENALIKRGVSENTAKQRVTSRLDSLTEDDIKELQTINSQEGIKDITEKFIALLNENRKNAKKPFLCSTKYLEIFLNRLQVLAE